jgi:hypothetical protein
MQVRLVIVGVASYQNVNVNYKGNPQEKRVQGGGAMTLGVGGKSKQNKWTFFSSFWNLHKRPD